jgi:hypothetical protein
VYPGEKRWSWMGKWTLRHRSSFVFLVGTISCCPGEEPLQLEYEDLIHDMNVPMGERTFCSASQFEDAVTLFLSDDMKARRSEKSLITFVRKVHFPALLRSDFLCCRVAREFGKRTTKEGNESTKDCPRI